MEKVKLLNNHESVTSQESMEMDEYSDEEDEVFVRGNRFFRSLSQKLFFCLTLIRLLELNLL